VAQGLSGGGGGVGNIHNFLGGGPPGTFLVGPNPKEGGIYIPDRGGNFWFIKFPWAGKCLNGGGSLA